MAKKEFIKAFDILSIIFILKGEGIE